MPEPLKCRLEPYLFEAGLDPGHSDRKFMVQGLVLYNVINKRRLEMEDICKGNAQKSFKQNWGEK